nr:MAG TPA: C2H2 type zinc-finger protein [Caudoviricetes sp.]
MRIIGMILTARDPLFLCPHCGKEYKNEAVLEKHIHEKHPEAQQPEKEATHAEN